MPIHFSCVKCGKKLFAQEHFSGRPVNCPACGTGNTIPAPALAPAPVDSSESEVAPGGALPAKAAPPAPIPLPPSPGDPPLRPCPLCAEKIQAAAKKCRFCGAYLDPEAELQQRGLENAVRQKSVRSSTSIWRIIARVATLAAIAWLMLLLIAILQQKDGSIFAALFDGLLIGGLLLSVVQMRNGPWHVFLVAALAVVVAMPLLSQLGFNMLTPETFRMIQEQNKNKPELANFTAEQYEQGMWVMMSLAGMIVSIPIWIAALKVAVAQRLASSKK